MLISFVQLFLLMLFCFMIVCDNQVNEAEKNNFTLNITSETINQSTSFENQSITRIDSNISHDILSFSEWKGLQNGQEDNVEFDENSETISLEEYYSNFLKSSQNFASKECGARVVTSNSETTNPGHILNHDLDAYALNPCYISDSNGGKIVTKIYFVVQLCEQIIIRSFSIANMEIYSSNPKTVALYYSASFNDINSFNNWEHVGKFQLNDSKDIQTVILEKATQFTKFIKIEILDFYESDPFCPVTILQVFGTSFIDKLTFKPFIKVNNGINESSQLQHRELEIIQQPHEISENKQSFFSIIIKYIISNSKKITNYKSNENNMNLLNNETRDVNESLQNVISSTKTISTSNSETKSLHVINEFCSILEINEILNICKNLTKISYPIYIKHFYVLNFSEICKFTQIKNPVSSYIKHIDNEIKHNISYQNNSSLDFDNAYQSSIIQLKECIRNIRRNLSLTTKYLEEVSIKFREAVEDLRNKTNNRLDILEGNYSNLYASVGELMQALYEQNIFLQTAFQQMITLIEDNNRSIPTNILLASFLYINAIVTHLYILYILKHFFINLIRKMFNGILILLNKIYILIKKNKNVKSESYVTLNNGYCTTHNHIKCDK